MYTAVKIYVSFILRFFSFIPAIQPRTSHPRYMHTHNHSSSGRCCPTANVLVVESCTAANGHLSLLLILSVHTCWAVGARGTLGCTACLHSSGPQPGSCSRAETVGTCGAGSTGWSRGMPHELKEDVGQLQVKGSVRSCTSCLRAVLRPHSRQAAASRNLVWRLSTLKSLGLSDAIRGCSRHAPGICASSADPVGCRRCRMLRTHELRD